MGGQPSPGAPAAEPTSQLLKPVCARARAPQGKARATTKTWCTQINKYIFLNPLSNTHIPGERIASKTLTVGETLGGSYTTKYWNILSTDKVIRWNSGFPGPQIIKNSPAEQMTRVPSLSQEDPLEKGMATHSSILAWRSPWAEEPGGLQSMGSKSRTWLSN